MMLNCAAGSGQGALLLFLFNVSRGVERLQSKHLNFSNPGCTPGSSDYSTFNNDKLLIIYSFIFIICKEIYSCSYCKYFSITHDRCISITSADCSYPGNRMDVFQNTSIQPT